MELVVEQVHFLGEVARKTQCAITDIVTVVYVP
jgi:hypothetical protein